MFLSWLLTEPIISMQECVETEYIKYPNLLTVNEHWPLTAVRAGVAYVRALDEILVSCIPPTLKTHFPGDSAMLTHIHPLNITTYPAPTDQMTIFNMYVN